jgi:predicted NAD/FAD-binding protein
MKIAVIGGGISGMTAAHLLARRHQVHLFEVQGRLGGHTHTHDIELDGKSYVIDSGFIVYNDRTYPNFLRLLDQLGISGRKSHMSFSVKCERTGLEYAGSSLNSLFAQRSNLLRIGYLNMLREILRFNRHLRSRIGALEAWESLGDYLDRNGYSHRFVDHYIVPMAAAIWSATHARVLDFPLEFFARFFLNHGLLDLNDRPQWYVIEGGSSSYIAPLTAPYRDNIHRNARIVSIARDTDEVVLRFADGDSQRFDHVVLACHSDQALALLESPTDAERTILGAIPYQANSAVLHTDTALLPKRRSAWAAWNYHVTGGNQSAALTYNMNLLQGIASPHTFCVTLNRDEAIDPAKVLRHMTYDHPVFTREGERAKAAYGDINYCNRTSYCGAYWGNGFHEDGVNSALAVAEPFGIEL